MHIVTCSSVCVTSFAWRSSHNGYCLTLACKAAYAIVPGISLPVREQELSVAENGYSDNGSFVADEILPFKPRADVVLVGQAFAPGKLPVRSVVTRLAVGSIDKSIEVFCDRWWTAVGSVREGSRFTQMPLLYERAAGGPGTANPVGMRPDIQPDKNGLVPIPNLQPPGLVVASRGVIIPPIGFGPIASTWPGRVEKLGSCAALWSDATWRQTPIPEGFDAAYFNIAPPDQQLDELPDDVTIFLENLHPRHPKLETRLMGPSPEVYVELNDKEPKEVRMRCDTLWIDTDRAVCTLTWRGTIELAQADEAKTAVITILDSTPSASSLRTTDVVRVSAHHRHVQEAGNTSIKATTVDDNQAKASPVVAKSPSHDRVAPTAFLASPGIASMSDQVERHVAISPTPARRPEVVPTVVLPEAPSPPVAGAPASASRGQEATASKENDLKRVPRPEVAQTAVLLSAPASPAVPFVRPAPPPDLHAPTSAAVPAPVPHPPSAAPAMSGLQGGEVSPIVGKPLLPSNVPLGSNARMGSLGDISSEAAGAQPYVEPRGSTPVVEAIRPLTPKRAARPRPRTSTELLWFDPAYVARMREHPDWQVVLAERELRDLDRKIERSMSGAAPSFDEPEPQEKVDRRDVFEILVRGEPISPARVKDAFDGAVDGDGMFEPPLVLIAGNLKFSFDEIECLKAAVAAVTPLLPAADKRLKEAVDAGTELLRSPWLTSARTLAERALTRIRKAFADTRRELPVDYVDELVERAVLQGRHYQRRSVLGQVWLRGFLHAGGTLQEVLLLYLPETLARELPMLTEVSVRVIAEVRGKQDKFEIQGLALRAVGVGTSA